VSAAVVHRGYTEEDDLNEEDLAISDHAADLHGDASASLEVGSLLNALLDPLYDYDEVLSNQVTIGSVVAVESLETTWFITHSGGDLRRVLISFSLGVYDIEYIICLIALCTLLQLSKS
jgi:hypothetical protein